MFTDTRHGVALRQLETDDSLFENRGSFCLARSITMLTLATICVALRFWCRKMRFTKYALDDWMLLAALVSTIRFYANGRRVAIADHKECCVTVRRLWCGRSKYF